jgi:hypothetical protein
VDQASIFVESLKENAVEFAYQKRRADGSGMSFEGVGPIKRMVVGSYPPQ